MVDTGKLVIVVKNKNNNNLKRITMKVKYGKGKTKYGTGVDIKLTGNEVAMAIYTYLTAHNIHVRGPATIRVNGELCKKGEIYVDPSGFVVAKGKKYSGRGKEEKNIKMKKGECDIYIKYQYDEYVNNSTTPPEVILVKLKRIEKLQTYLVDTTDKHQDSGKYKNIMEWGWGWNQRLIQYRINLLANWKAEK